jgi:hypothetical protein
MKREDEARYMSAFRAGMNRGNMKRDDENDYRWLYLLVLGVAVLVTAFALACVLA